MCFTYCHQAPFHHIFFLLYFADRKDEISTEEMLQELGETSVFSTGELRFHFICFWTLTQIIMKAW